jgi:O-antigen/teichoic acid export membrane protein
VSELDVLDTPEAGRRVVRGGALRVAGFVVGIACSVIAAALVTRHLGTVDYGRYQTVVALVTIIQAVTDLGMTTLGLREYVQRRGEERTTFMRVLLGLRLALTALGIVAATVAAVVLGYDAEMIAGAALMGLGVMISILAWTLAIPLSAELRMGLVTALDLGRQLLTAVAIVVVVLVGGGLIPLLALQIPVSVLLLATTLSLVRGVMPLRPMFHARRWVTLLRPTVTFSLATAVGMLYIYAALVLTELVASDHETGLFAASFRVFVIVGSVPGVLVTTAFPVLSRAARDDRERLSYAAQRLFEGCAVLGGAALVFCVVGAKPIIDIVAGSQFAGSVPVLRIQGAVLALTFVIAVWGFTLLALHRHREMIAVNLVALTVSAVTVLTLASAHGATGAAVGTLLGESVLACGYLIALARCGRALVPRPGRVARALPALGLALACLALPVPAIASTVLALAVYATGALLCRAVPDELTRPLARVLAVRGRGA